VCSVLYAQEFANSYNIPFVRTSAKTGEGIEKAFVELSKAIMSRMTPKPATGQQGNVKPGKDKSGKRRCDI
jgi:hypothetical protein